jgi:hypothetical protein
VAGEDDIHQDIDGGSGPLWESVGPLYVRTGPPGEVQNLHGRAPNPKDGSRTPLCGVRATHSKVPGFWDKEYPGLNQGQVGVRTRHVSGPYRVRYRSPLRRSPDAATWPTACDVSRRAEPDVRPLGRAATAFIADKACRLFILLAGDVPPQHLMSPATPLAGDVPPRHLMCPVHFADGQRLGHPAGGVPVQSVGRQYARAAAYTMLIITRALPRKERRISIPYALRTLWRSEIFWATLALDTSIVISFHFAPRPTCRGSVPLYVPPLSYKREGTRRYKAASLRPNIDTQTHKFIQALKLNTSHSGVGYYAPAARTTLNPCVFLCSSSI